MSCCRSRSQVLFPAIILFAALALTGCMRHAATAGSFTYTSIDSQNFVLPPATPAATASTLTIPLTIAGLPHDQTLCVIHQQWFSFYPTATGTHVQWFAQTPSAGAWAQSGGSVDMAAEWKQFLRALDALQQKGCFVSPNEPALIQAEMAASMALPDQDTLLYHYGFGEGGYINLTAGMQFQIERVLSTPVMDPVTHKVTNLDQMVTVYGVIRGEGSGVHLRLLRNGTYTHFETTTHPAASTFPDLALAARFSATPHLRLMLRTVVIADNINRPAILLGAADTAQLDAAANQLMAESKTSCQHIAALPVTCAQFEGTVSVGPRLGVSVNRHLVYVPVGDRLWSVLPRPANSLKRANPPTLRVQRKIENRYVDIRPANGTDNLSQLTLLQGDRISW